MPENRSLSDYPPWTRPVFFWAILFCPLITEALVLGIAARSDSPSPYLLWFFVAAGCCVYCAFRLGRRWVRPMGLRVAAMVGIFSVLIVLNLALMLVGVLIFDPPDFR